MNGRPVRPRSLTSVSAPPAAMLPPNAHCTSAQPIPASASAWRAANAPWARPDTPGWRPNGWMPIPTMATATVDSDLLARRGDRREREGHALGPVGVAADRDDGELQLRADLQAERVGGGEAGLDQHRRPAAVFDGQLDVPDAVGPERAVGGVRRLGLERLDGPGPQPAGRGQQHGAQVGPGAAGAGLLGRERGGGAGRAGAADQARVVGPGKKPLGHRHRGGHDAPAVLARGGRPPRTPSLPSARAGRPTLAAGTASPSLSVPALPKGRHWTRTVPLSSGSNQASSSWPACRLRPPRRDLARPAPGASARSTPAARLGTAEAA